MKKILLGLYFIVSLCFSNIISIDKNLINKKPENNSNNLKTYIEKFDLDHFIKTLNETPYLSEHLKDEFIDIIKGLRSELDINTTNIFKSSISVFTILGYLVVLDNFINRDTYLKKEASWFENIFKNTFKKALNKYITNSDFNYSNSKISELPGQEKLENSLAKLSNLGIIENSLLFIIVPSFIVYNNAPKTINFFMRNKILKKLEIMEQLLNEKTKNSIIKN